MNPARTFKYIQYLATGLDDTRDEDVLDRAEGWKSAVGCKDKKRRWDSHVASRLAVANARKKGGSSSCAKVSFASSIQSCARSVAMARADC